MPTGKTVAAPVSPVPRPRMYQRGRPSPSGFLAEALGTKVVMSPIERTPSAVMLVPLIADTATGTSCRVCSRCWAVTVTVSRAGSVLVSSLAATAWPPVPANSSARLIWRASGWSWCMVDLPVCKALLGRARAGTVPCC
ncbi:hypothetical protein D3C79_933150 [compost metagenome]